MAERRTDGAGRDGHSPPGWPAQVRPPGTPGWERTAIGWLLDLCPPDYRAYDVLRKYPVILARFAAVCVESAAEGARRGLAEGREDLRGIVPPEAVEAALQAYEREGARLLAAARGVLLVEQALRGQRFVPRL